MKILSALILLATLVSCDTNHNNTHYISAKKIYSDQQVHDSIQVHVERSMSYATTAAEKDIYKVRYGVDSIKPLTQREALQLLYNIIKSELQESKSDNKKKVVYADSVLRSIKNSNNLTKDYYSATVFVEMTQGGEKSRFSSMKFFDTKFSMLN